MKNLLLLALLVSASSCFNDLKRGKAPSREAWTPKNGNALKVYKEMETGPDTLVAFFWPSEDFYNRHNGTYFNEPNYQAFITKNSESVFRSSDEFDVWMKKIFNEVPLIREKIELIQVQEIEPVKAEIKGITKQDKELKAEHKNLKKTIKKDKKQHKSLVKTQTTEKETLEIKKQEFQANPTQELKQEIEELEANITKLETQIVELAEKIEIDEARYEAIPDIRKDLFAQKKELQASLEPIEAKIAENRKEQDTMNFWQKEMLNRIQAGIDPQAIEKKYDEDENVIINEYGLEESEILASKQLHWIQTYDPAGTPRDKNHVIFKNGVIDIRFGEWGLNKLDYSTKYEKDAEGNLILDGNGKPTLASDSDFYDISLDKKDVLRFKIREKDRFGNPTRQGSYLAFTLQRSEFEGHLRLVGDMFRYTPGVSEPERGQAKVFLVKKDKAFLACNSEGGAYFEAAREENREEFKTQCGKATMEGSLCFTGQTLVAKSLLEKYAENKFIEEEEGGETTVSTFFAGGYTLKNIRLVDIGKIAYDVHRAADEETDTPEYWTSAEISRCSQ